MPTCITCAYFGIVKDCDGAEFMSCKNFESKKYSGPVKSYDSCENWEQQEILDVVE